MRTVRPSYRNCQEAAGQHATTGPVRMTEAQRIVLKYIEEHGPCSYTEVQEQCGLSGVESSDAFEELADQGIVVMLPYRDGEQQLWVEGPRQRSLFG